MDAAMFSKKYAARAARAIFIRVVWLSVSFLFLAPIHLHAQYMTVEIEKVQLVRSLTAVALTKHLFYHLESASLDDSITLGARVNALARATPECREAIARFLKK